MHLKKDETIELIGISDTVFNSLQNLEILVKPDHSG